MVHVALALALIISLVLLRGIIVIPPMAREGRRVRA